MTQFIGFTPDGGYITDDGVVETVYDSYGNITNTFPGGGSSVISGNTGSPQNVAILDNIKRELVESGNLDPSLNDINTRRLQDLNIAQTGTATGSNDNVVSGLPNFKLPDFSGLTSDVLHQVIIGVIVGVIVIRIASK